VSVLLYTSLSNTNKMYDMLDMHVTLFSVEKIGEGIKYRVVDMGLYNNKIQ